MDLINAILRKGAQSNLSETEFLELEIKAWLSSNKRKAMLVGRKYFEGEQDILNKRREMIGDNGKRQTLYNLPNNQIVNNQYGKLVDQKVNYLLTKPMEVRVEDENYQKALDKVFNKAFQRRLKNIGEDSINAGVAYLHPYIDNNELKLKRFRPEEILAFWADDEHEYLDAFARVYVVQQYVGRELKNVTKVEYYTGEGVKYYTFENDKLTPEGQKENINKNGQPLNWERIPLIAFKYNNAELPLIKRIKCLQDALNTLMSNFADNMQEDVRSTVLVIHNYDGENLGDFRKNLATYGAIKVRSEDNVKGDVTTLHIDVNAQNYELVIKLLKKAIIENGRGYDAKDERMNGNPNQMNIQSMYSDIDLDANSMELEYQAGLEQLMFFVNTYLRITEQQAGSQPVEFVFNRDILINESEAIENCAKSTGIISQETIIANHPWTQNTQEELSKLNKQRQEDIGSDYAKKDE